MSSSSDVDTAEFAAPLDKGRDRPDLYSAMVRIDLGGLSHVGEGATKQRRSLPH
jgi:hypothetical protein